MQDPGACLTCTWPFLGTPANIAGIRPGPQNGPLIHPFPCRLHSRGQRRGLRPTGRSGAGQHPCLAFACSFRSTVTVTLLSLGLAALCDRAVAVTEAQLTTPAAPPAARSISRGRSCLIYGYQSSASSIRSNFAIPFTATFMFWPV